MYRCGVCGGVSEPGEARFVQYIYRANKEIEREISICHSCYVANKSSVVSTEGKVVNGVERTVTKAFRKKEAQKGEKKRSYNNRLFRQ